MEKSFAGSTPALPTNFKLNQMDEHRKQDLWMIFKEYGEVTVTYVNDQQEDEDVTYTIFEEAVNDIRVRGSVDKAYF